PQAHDSFASASQVLIRPVPPCEMSQGAVTSVSLFHVVDVFFVCLFFVCCFLILFFIFLLWQVN
ncbi:hypothetical protein ACQP3F_34300, partial [Escherichia coli]